MSEPRLPTEEEIAVLPWWARVAFAARCARRALLFCRLAWPDAPADFLNSIDLNIAAAERAAASAANTIRDISGFITGPEFATATARAAIHARRAVFDVDFSSNNAVLAATSAADVGIPKYSIADDFQRLLAAARAGQWDDSTPVPPSVFDSLDAPAPSPAALSPPTRLVIKAYMRPDADPVKVADKMVELYAALNDYSLEKYGVGLDVKDFEQFLKTGVLDPVGGPSL